MNDELAAKFMAIHMNYRAQIAAVVVQLDDDEIREADQFFDHTKLNSRPENYGLVAAHVRYACKKELERRAAAQKAETKKETEA